MKLLAGRDSVSQHHYRGADRGLRRGSLLILQPRCYNVPRPGPGLPWACAQGPRAPSPFPSMKVVNSLTATSLPLASSVVTVRSTTTQPLPGQCQGNDVGNCTSRLPKFTSPSRSRPYRYASLPMARRIAYTASHPPAHPRTHPCPGCPPAPGGSRGGRRRAGEPSAPGTARRAAQRPAVQGAAHARVCRTRGTRQHGRCWSHGQGSPAAAFKVSRPVSLASALRLAL